MSQRISRSDSELFRRVVSEVKRLPNSDSEVTPQLQSPKIVEPPTSPKTPSSLKGITSLEGNLFYRPGVQKKTLKNLKRGRPAADAEIDLHGCTRYEALDYLQAFFTECNRKQASCVRLVTGKGRSSPNRNSVVREITLSWLRQQPQVLAYCTAPDNKGGTGAFYVLLSP